MRRVLRLTVAVKRRKGECLTEETWLPIPGYEAHYEISDRGRVRSLDRYITDKNGFRRFHRGVIRKPKRHRGGYLELPLSLVGCRVMYTVHRLVMMAFIGPRPSGLEICHNNGDKTDNRLSNLRYDTRSANCQDSLKHGNNWHSNKTHCPQGHPYDEDNTKYDANGGRHCFICSRAAVRSHYYNNPEYYRVRNERRRAKREVERVSA